MSQHHDIHLIGFDLGHGKIALSQINMPAGQVYGKTAPGPLLIHGQSSEVTAIAEDPVRGVTLFGEAAVRNPRVVELQIAFKARPSYSETSRKSVVKLSKTVYEHLVEKRRLNPDAQNYFFVGCPSGWEKREIKLYTQLMEQAGLPRVKVVKESRAALMHAKESNQLTRKELAQSVLVVDLGSSTTDYTLVKAGSNQPIDFGEDLGASLIDKAILKYSLERDEDKAVLEEIFSKKSSFKFRCEYLCRKAKEKCFSHPEIYQEEDTEVSVGSVKERHQGGRRGRIRFEPLLNGPILDEIIHQPIPELHGRSWPDAFRYQLQEVKRKLAEERIRPSAILLTGGASKMEFVPQICAEVFPSSPLKLDNAPELCIAKGLARWGRVYIQTSRFIAKVEQFKSQKLKRIVEKEQPALINLLAEELANRLVDEVLIPRLRDWRNSRIKTLNDLEQAIMRSAKEWLKGTKARKLIREQVHKWLGTVKKEIQNQIDTLCREEDLNPAVLKFGSIDLPTDSRKFSGKLSVADELAEAISSFTQNIMSTIMAILFAGAGLVVLGPIGGIIGFLIGYLGSDVGKEKIKETNHFGVVREWSVSPEKINKLGREQKTELRKQIQNMFTQDPHLLNKLVRPMIQWLETEVQEIVDRARLFIT